MKDETLLEQFFATGHLPHFRAIYDRHSGAIRQFVRGKYLKGNSKKAAKVTEWTFRQLLDHPERYDRKFSLRPWLFSLAAERAIKIRNTAEIIGVCKSHGVISCDWRGMVKLARKGGRICPGLSSRLGRANYRACIEDLCAMLNEAA